MIVFKSSLVPLFLKDGCLLQGLGTNKIWLGNEEWTFRGNVCGEVELISLSFRIPFSLNGRHMVIECVFLGLKKGNSKIHD